ncbi:MAG: bifunctional nicotinamidase/pyrazinamidase [Treponema sp.]|jgi:nicotinamidase/pyrazinamidase|nr:bifunctional nicotinamidase/pyrazinamidase [Treponema sp.]
MIANSRGYALLVIDVQNDFCPSYTSVSGEKYPAGALAVGGGDEVVAPLNALARRLAAAGGRVIATQDWHPAGHVSFASAHPGKKPGETAVLPGIGVQALWPDHCVQGSFGAAFHEKLDLGPVNLVLRKGFRPGLDSYSAFFENDRTTLTGLEGFLKGLGVDTVLIGGLATDYCVFYSALDAVRLGFKTLVPGDAVRGVGYPEGSVEKALAEMKAAGIGLVSSEEFL